MIFFEILLTLYMRSVLGPSRFTMEHQFDRYGERDSARGLMVPFEHYGFHAFAFAIDPVTNNSVQIAMFCIVDTLGDFVIRPYNAADTTKFTYESKDGLVATEVESRVIRVEIERSAIAKAFVVCLSLGNWAVTVSSVYTTALVVFGKLEANSMIAALPFSALLAIPTIRSLYIGSPPLGSSVGNPFISPHQFHGLIRSTRCSCVLRAGCDHRITPSGPHSMRIIEHNEIPCLDLRILGHIIVIRISSLGLLYVVRLVQKISGICTSSCFKICGSDSQYRPSPKLSSNTA